MNNREVVIEALLSALNREKEPTAKANIVGGLALIADPKTVTSFCDVVKISADKHTICNAIEALKSIRNKQAILGLITVFANSQEAIRLKAVESMIDIGPPAVDSLILALKDNSSPIRQNAAICLGEMGEERALEHLIPLLNDEEPNVRGAAAFALGAIEKQPDSDVNVSYS